MWVLFIIIVLHLSLVFGGFYFLSPEISLYPYLTGQGLLPYRDLIDQHLPLIFFGPLHLGQLAITSPLAAKIGFVAVLLLTDLAFIKVIKGRTSRGPTPEGPTPRGWSLFLAFVATQLLLGGSVFWLESFILLFLLSFFYFVDRRPLLAGLFLSLVVGTKPLLLPLALFFLYRHRRHWRPLVLGLLVVPLIQITWLSYHRLWPEFLELMNFNRQYYLPLAAKLPTLLQLGLLAFAILPLLSRSNLIPISLLALSAYPRFELFHLLPLAALIEVPSSRGRTSRGPTLIGWSLLALTLILVRHPYQSRDYYYPSELGRLAAALKDRYPSATYYFFGGPDQLYQLTQSTPPDKYYQPSLPWYLANPDFTARQTRALGDSPLTPIVVNLDSRVDGVSVLDSGRPIWEYINSQYNQVDQIGHWAIYQ